MSSQNTLQDLQGRVCQNKLQKDLAAWLSRFLDVSLQRIFVAYMPEVEELSAILATEACGNTTIVKHTSTMNNNAMMDGMILWLVNDSIC